MAIVINGSGTVTGISVGGLPDSIVDSGTLADDAVGLAQMASGTDGNIITYDTSGNPAVVATGSSGQVLTSAGADAVPTMAAVAASDNTPSFHVKNSGSIAVSSSTWQTMIFDTKVWDTDTAYSTVTGKFTVPSGEAGKYLFIHYLSQTVQSGDQWTVDIVKNSGASITGIRYASFTMSTDTGYLAVAGMDDLDVGDTVYGRQWLPRAGSSGGHFSGYKLAGV